MLNSKLVAVVPAAGIGSRMQADRPKQYLKIGDKTILEHTLLKLAEHPQIDRVIVAINPEDGYFNQLPIIHSPWLCVVEGGDSRAASVRNALTQLDDNDWALVHDAARPCLSRTDLNKLIALTQNTLFSGGILATPVRDTMKRAHVGAETPTVKETECRENLWHALTPQLFNAKQLINALDHAKSHGINVTDEASAMEHMQHPVALIEGNPANIKITRPADLPLAQFYLQQSDAKI